MEIEILNQEKMDNYNFTKGNWAISSHFHIWADNTKIADCTNNNQATIYRIKKKKEMKANALLISKAPEMLEKLAEVKDLLEAYPSEAEMHLKAVEIRQLIKEATEI